MADDYTCDACGTRTHAEHARGHWLALRLAGDRRGIEIRKFENSGPDDRYVCSEACALRRISEIFAGLTPR